MMEYGVWCLSQDVKSRKEPDVYESEEVKNMRKRQNVTEKLNSRLYDLLSHYYGEKAFTMIDNRAVLSYEEMQEFHKQHEKEIEKEYQKYLKYEKEIEKLSSLANLDPYEEIKRSKKENKKEEVVKKIERLLSTEDMIFFQGREKRFVDITDNERVVFEFLLNDDKYKLLTQKEISVDAIKSRKEFLGLLSKVQPLENWEFSKTEMKKVKRRLLAPSVDKLMDIYDYIVDNNDEDDDEVAECIKTINSIGKKIDNLYKKIICKNSKIDLTSIIESALAKQPLPETTDE